MLRVISFAAVLLLAPGTVLAMTGDGDGAEPREFKQAGKAIKKQEYEEALALLAVVVDADPENANAWNLIGFSHRNLKNFDAALEAYERALAIDPKHRGAIEYLGELYLMTGQLDKAQDQLQRLDDICFLKCREMRALAAAIEEFEESGSNAGP